MSEPSEIVDLIDEGDNVIGQADIRDVHKNGLLHRYTHIIVELSDGRIVSQLRHHGMTNYPLTYDASVGEHVSAGETYLDAAMRGCSEELGITVQGNQLTDIGRIENRSNPARENLIGRLFLLKHDGPFHPQEDEIEELTFFTRSELAKMLVETPDKICGNFVSSAQLYLSR